MPAPSESGRLPAERGQAPRPPQALSEDSCPAVCHLLWAVVPGTACTWSAWAVSGEGCEQLLAQPPSHLDSSRPPSLTTYPPPTSPSYQRSGKDEERPHLGPKANGDQPAEGRATAPLVLGGCVLNSVHSETKLLSALHAWALSSASLAQPSPCYLVAWLMSKGQEEGPLQQPMERVLSPGTVVWLPSPLALSPGEDDMEPQAPGITQADACGRLGSAVLERSAAKPQEEIWGIMGVCWFWG